MKKTLLPYAAMLAGCFSFAWMSKFANQLGTELGYDWRLVALARSSLVLAFSLALALSSGAKLVFWRPGILWVRSVAGSLSLLCTFYALSRLSAPEVLTLTNTFPIWVALLSWPLLQERPTPAVWLAAGCGVAGIVLIEMPHLDEGALTVGNTAVPLALCAAVSSAVAMLGLHRLQGIDARAIVVHFSLVATLCTAAACCTGEAIPWAEALSSRNAVLLLGVGLTATVGQLLLTLAFRTGEPAKVSVVGLTQIVFALGLDLFFGSPGFAPLTLAGIGLVLAPTAWVMAGRAVDS